MKKLLAITIMLVSTNVLAFEKEDSMSSLQAAMFESNKDYNTNKKVVLDAENDRIDNWNGGDTVTVKIRAGIEVNSRTYLMGSDELEQVKAEKEDLAEFQKAKENLPAVQEVSMNN